MSRPPGSWFLLCFAGGYLRLCVFLCRSGAPSWLVNFPQVLLHLLPHGFRAAAFGELLCRNELKNWRPS
jgi:hypothetical protein